jgi:hypothetical protein
VSHKPDSYYIIEIWAAFDQNFIINRGLMLPKKKLLVAVESGRGERGESKRKENRI